MTDGTADLAADLVLCCQRIASGDIGCDTIADLHKDAAVLADALAEQPATDTRSLAAKCHAACVALAEVGLAAISLAASAFDDLQAFGAVGPPPTPPKPPRRRRGRA